MDLCLPHPAPVPSEPEAWASVTLECLATEGPDVVKNGTCAFSGEAFELRCNNTAEAYEIACSRRVEPSCGKYADAGGWDVAADPASGLWRRKGQRPKTRSTASGCGEI